MKPVNWKKLVIAISVFLALGLTAAFVIPRLIDVNQYRGLISDKIEKATGGKVEIGRISWGIAENLWIQANGFSITGAKAFPGDLEFSRLYARVALRPLLTKKVLLEEVILDGITCTLRLEPATGKTPAERPEPVTSAFPVALGIEKLDVRNGNIRLVDAVTLPGQKKMRLFSSLDLTAKNIIPGKPMEFRISMRDSGKPGLGHLSAEGAFTGLTETLTIQDPKITLNATISFLDLDAIKPFLKKSAFSRKLGGSASVEVKCDGEPGKRLRIEGKIDLTRLTYKDPSLWEKGLPEADTSLDYQLVLDSDLLTLEKAAITLGNVTLDTRAIVEDWQSAPVIKDAVLYADIPLAEAIPFIPWKRLGKKGNIIKKMLEKGGRITVTEAVLPEIRVKEPPGDLKSLIQELRASIRVSDLFVKLSPDLPEVENINGTIRLEKGVAKVDVIRASSGSVNLPKIFAEISNLTNKPIIAARVRGSVKIDETIDKSLSKRLRKYHIEKLTGVADLDLNLQMETARPESLRLEGKVGFRDVRVATSLAPVSLEGLAAEVLLKPEAAEISMLKTAVVLPPAKPSQGGSFTLELAGSVEKWRKNPAITLRKLKTSPISLSSLVPLALWKKLGASTEMIRDMLLAGGTVTIEDAAISNFDLGKPLEKPLVILNRARGLASFAGISLRPSPDLPRLKLLKGRASLEKGALSADNVQASMGLFKLPTVDIHVTHLSARPRVSAAFNGPVVFKETDQAAWGKLLKQYGLKSLSGRADIAMKAEYDALKPDEWEAHGFLVLGGIRAKIHPAGIRLEDLRGRVRLDRKGSLNISLKELTGRVNNAPVRLTGRIAGGGTPDLVIDAKIQTERLDLAHLVELVPALEKMEPEGRVDADLGIYLPFNDPRNTRLDGAVKIRGLGIRWLDRDVAVEEGDADVELAGDIVSIKSAELRVNGQKLTVSGQLMNFFEPDVLLNIKSSHLNLDRLLHPGGNEKRSPGTGREGREEMPPAGKSRGWELPPLANKLKARVNIEANQGKFHGQLFREMKIAADYEYGTLKSYDLDLHMAGGRIRTTGFADLRNPNAVLFSAKPDIRSVRIEEFVHLFGIDKFHLQGPVTAKGLVQGRTGSNINLLSGLSGSLEAEITQGRINQLGTAGSIIGKAFSFLSPRSLLFFKLKEDLGGEGVPFRKLKSKVSFESGQLTIHESMLESSALNGVAEGAIDLVDGKLDIDMGFQPLVTLDKALGLVPLVGKRAADLTMISLDVTGSLKDPLIKMSATEKVIKPMKKLLRIPMRILKRPEGQTENEEN